MLSDTELSRILNSLQETDQDDLVTEERARRQQARQSRVAADLESMDVDDDLVSFILSHENNKYHCIEV
jgi:pre-mRNA-splicing helicase BRR2